MGKPIVATDGGGEEGDCSEQVAVISVVIEVVIATVIIVIIIVVIMAFLFRYIYTLDEMYGKMSIGFYYRYILNYEDD